MSTTAAPAPLPVQTTWTKFIEFYAADPAEYETIILKFRQEDASKVAKSKAGKKQTGGDYWGGLRKRIVKMHIEGETLEVLDEYVSLKTKAETQKRTDYLERVERYQHWLDGRHLLGFKAKIQFLPVGPLQIKVAPDVILSIDGVGHLLHLYCKAAVLTERERQLRLWMLARLAETGATGAIVDVSRSELLPAAVLPPGFEEHVLQVAYEFARFWHSI